MLTPAHVTLSHRGMRTTVQTSRRSRRENHAISACSFWSPARARSARPAEDFAEIAARARGQTVYFNAWGGSRQINDYIAWAGQEVQRRFGVELVQVKLTDTGEAVSPGAAPRRRRAGPKAARST